MGAVNDIDLAQLYDEARSLREGAIKVPGFTAEGWQSRMFGAAGLDLDKPIGKYTKKELHLLLHQEPIKVKVVAANLTYEGLVPRIQKSFLSKDLDAMQPHVRAFVERAVTFTTCPDCAGTRLCDAARSSKIAGRNIADACAMQITDLAAWVRVGVEPRGVGDGVEVVSLPDDVWPHRHERRGYRPSSTVKSDEAPRAHLATTRSRGSSTTGAFARPHRRRVRRPPRRARRRHRRRGPRCA